jgi:hypothetical protein
VTSQFPAIADHIFGEESNTFSNTLGDTITVEVQADQAATAILLSTVCRSVISYFLLPSFVIHLHAANTTLVAFCFATADIHRKLWFSG